jgi:hypothetical protein
MVNLFSAENKQGHWKNSFPAHADSLIFLPTRPRSDPLVVAQAGGRLAQAKSGGSHFSPIPSLGFRKEQALRRVGFDPGLPPALSLKEPRPYFGQPSDPPSEPGNAWKSHQYFLKNWGVARIDGWPPII